MEDPSITKRLIDFGTDDHEYDEVEESPEDSKNQQSQQKLQQQQQQQSQQKQQQQNSAQTTERQFYDLPPELPPPKQKAVKSSKNKSKSKSKSKIPRSPSLAISLSGGSVSGNGNGNGSNSVKNSGINNNSDYQQQQQLPTPNAIPPQTPPLPANYQNKSKHMNGGTAGTTQSPTTTTTATTTTTTPIIQQSANNNNNATSNSYTIMGGGVQLSNTGLGIGGGGGGGTAGGAASTNGNNGNNNHRSASINLAGGRRPQIQISPITESPKHFQFLTLTVRKDENGYGMKVSGDNPVFVESVKPGGAAQIAGLVAGDMILKVNGQEVRSEKHPTVVSLIKSSNIVELAVKRSQKMARPTSVGIVPSTPILSVRDRTASITGPQPVDSIKRREMETYKIQTLQKMLEQEKLNLERLKGDTNNPSYKLSEANIRKLREQLRQIGAEDAPPVKHQSSVNNKGTAILSPNQIHHLSASSQHHHHHLQHQQHFNIPQQHNYHQQQATTPQPQTQSSPAFLSLLPRSLSSLSLGTRKNKIDKDLITSPLNNTTDFLNTSSITPMSSHHNSSISPMSQSYHQQQRNSPQFLSQQQQQLLQQRLKETPKSSGSKSKSKFAAQATINLIHEDIPPPLPQRNPPRCSLQLDVTTANANLITNNNNNNNNSMHMFAPISDLDHTSSPQRNSPQSVNQAQSSSSAAQKKRSKAKTKALSDPKMSTQMFLQMEIEGTGASGSGNRGNGSNFDGTNETDCVPPPLPPRQSGMMEETTLAGHRGSFQNLSRPPPNSIDSLLNYPLVSTCTAVHRDNMAAAFPLSQRPNIVQQLQQHQQLHGGGVPTAALGQTPHNLNHMNKHRRVLSSPDNMHPRHPDRLNKTTSGSWELVEKDDEETPPGTPPPPYLTAHSTAMSGSEDPSMISSTPTMASSSNIFVESHHFIPLGSVGGGATSTPPLSALHSSRIQAAQSSATQRQIMSMEDETASDTEEPFIDENGPFNYLPRLLEAENVAFLAVFLNYVLSNSEPAPLLFYLITSLYKEGTAKDMRKWAYEIHSTFLVPRAPLSWYRQDEALAREVDNVLQNEFDKVEILRNVFWKSRKRARDIICEQLREFQQKRTAGLGTMFGPTDAQLAEARGDKQQEQHIFEDILLEKLQKLIDEYEKDAPIEDPKKLALCSALSTVIHRIFITRSHPNNIIDRVHHFVSREKSFKSRLMGKNRKMIVRGHPLVLRQYYEVTHCNHCQTIIWGVSPQGYHCTDCKLNIHRPCSKVLDESCPGPLTQTKHNDNKISKFMGKIRPRTSSDFIAAEKRARHEEDLDSADVTNERLNATSIVRQPSDRRPDASGGVSASSRPNGNAAHNSSDLQTSFHARSASGDGGSGSNDGTQNAASSGAAAAALGATAAGGDINAQDAAAGNIGGDSKDARRERLHHQHQQNKSAPVSVNRSESYKERLSHKRNRNSRRKTSDPSLTSRPNDDQTEAGLSNSNYTASSNSSLSSGGSESPSTSIEQVGGSTTATSGATAAAHQHHHHHHHGGSVHHHGPHHAHQHSHHDSFHGSLGGSSGSASFWGGSIGGASGPTLGQLTRQWNFDSDDDDDLNEADWGSNVAAELLAALTDAEKKRQEIINEIYQTERSHVRTLKLLERLFFCPLQESGVLSNDHLKLLFPPALLSLRELHSAFESRLKQRRLEHNHVVNHVGDLLASMFDGPAGDELREFAAQFCARQQIALEALKEKRRKDEQLQKLLSKAESHKACRRLQLKDLLPTVLQRLTKYPLLFENLYKVTIRVLPENTTEADAIQRALESSKKILVDVNQAVKTAEDAHKLQNIQRKLDKSFDKDEFKNLDLTQYRLIHDGSLTMKKNPSIQLHGLLFENMIVLLTKQDDKYSLKYLHAARNTEVNNKPVNPIMSIDSETLVRQEAADKNSFFLIKTKTSQMLELRAPSSSECKTGMRRKSLCNGALLTLSSHSQNGKNGSSAGDSANSTPSKSKKERRRGSFNEASANSSGGRRASLVSRWFKHISDAAEQYKPRSKNANHEPVDDPAIATLPHSNTKESLELTPERPPPLSATATVTTTPLAPMMPPPIVHTPHVNNNNYDGGIQMRNGRRESTPTSINVTGNDGPAYQNLQHRQNLSQYELSPAVNRTMSTRSCGEANNNYGADQVATINGVTLRHTQSARQASASDAVADGAAAAAGGATAGPSKRDSASIVYSNNSNNTRTLMQSSPPLVEPTAIQISISPAHTAEPVLTPSERLRRLDAAIRDGLLEKQKIICDMFRLPVEHFHEIVDIAAMPEAPKDSADIALAAYAQVQSLTEVLNDYMHVTAEQEISAVSTAVCDQCHEKQRHHQQQLHQQQQQQGGLSTSTSSSSGVSAVTQIHAVEQTPPPLPPPNKTPAPQTAQQQTPAPTAAKLQTPIAALDEVNIHEDDDGYCEIDEFRLPALPPLITVADKSAASSPPPLPPPAGSFKTPPPPPPAAAAAQAQTQTQVTKATASAASSPTPELIKRQSTISTDSIPEESADELTQATMDENKENVEADTAELNSTTKEHNFENETTDKAATTTSTTKIAEIGEDKPTTSTANQQTALNELSDETELSTSVVAPTAAADKVTTESNSNEQTAINEALSTLSKLSAAISTVDSTTQTMPLMNNNNGTNSTNINGGLTSPLCGPNRIQHANSLEPSIPCHALNGIVSALNSQISLLLPKINERDTERERLRKENQHLRELLNAMHERQRVEDNLETPKDNNAAAAAVGKSQKDADTNDEIDGTNNKKNFDKPDAPTTTTTTESTTTTTNTTTPTLKAEKIEN